MTRIDERLTKLGADLDELAHGRAAQRDMHAQSRLPSNGRGHRHRAVGPRVAAVTAAIVVIILVALVLVTRSTDQPSSGTDRPPAASSATITPTAGRPSRVTAEQLAAHLGVGAPAGWLPVDAATARIFVPADWPVAAASDCIGTDSGIVSIGRLPDRNCLAFLSVASPTDGAALLPGPTHVKGRPSRIVNGFAVYGPDTTTDPAWVIYTVPALATQLAVRGTNATQILDTLTVPASTVAIDTAASLTPHALARYNASGNREAFRSTYRLTVPTNWRVTEPTSGLCSLTGSNPPELIELNMNVTQPSCPVQFPTPQSLLGDGAVLYWPGATVADTSAGGTASTQTLITLRRGDAVVSAHALDAATGAVVITITVGKAEPHVMTLLLGRDGRVAGRVLASIGPSR